MCQWSNNNEPYKPRTGDIGTLRSQKKKRNLLSAILHQYTVIIIIIIIMAPNGEEGHEIDAMEAGKTVESEAHRVRKSTHSGAMASSILRFKDVNFIVGKGDKEKYILQDVSGKVKFGRECSSCCLRLTLI